MGKLRKAIRATGRFSWQLWKKIYHRWYDRGGERYHPLELRHKKHPGLWDYLGDPKRDQRSSKYAVRRQKRLERRRQRRLLRRDLMRRQLPVQHEQLSLFPKNSSEIEEACACLHAGT